MVRTLRFLLSSGAVFLPLYTLSTEELKGGGVGVLHTLFAFAQGLKQESISLCNSF